MAFISMSVSTAGFDRYAGAMRGAGPRLKAKLEVRQRAWCEVVAADTRRRLQRWHNAPQAAPSVRVTQYSPDTVAVVAGGPGAPMVKAFEDGKNDSGTFRAPLFGNRSQWYEHAAHPSLKPATKAHEPEWLLGLAAETEEALEEVARAAGGD